MDKYFYAIISTSSNNAFNSLIILLDHTNYATFFCYSLPSSYFFSERKYLEFLNTQKYVIYLIPRNIFKNFC